MQALVETERNRTLIENCIPNGKKKEDPEKFSLSFFAAEFISTRYDMPWEIRTINYKFIY